MAEKCLQQAFGLWLSVVVSCCQSTVMEVVVMLHNSTLSLSTGWSGRQLRRMRGEKGKEVR